MTTIVTIIVIALIAGIIYINRSSSNNIKTREDFLSALAKFVHGKLEPQEGLEGAFKITFNFEGVDFTYEDIMIPGFKNDKVNKAYLRVNTNSSLTLSFEEKRGGSDVFRSNQSIFNKPGAPGGHSKLKVPDKLKNFKIETDDLELVDKVFRNPRSVKILSDYKNLDPRGYPFMALRIKEGLIVLQFSREKRYNPNLQTVRGNIHIFEDHLKDLIHLKRIIESNIKSP